MLPMEFGGLEKFTLIDFPGKTACMVYTIGCNFRCPYCHNPELVDETVENIFSEATILDFLKKRQRLFEGVVITGGEPTIHENLPAFMRKVKDLGFAVKLDSNGTNPDMLKKVIADGVVDYIAMDIKSPLSKYSQTVGRPVSLDAIRESITILKTSGVPYEFRTTVIKSLLTPEDIEGIAKEIEGADKYYIQKFVPTKILNPQFLRKTQYTNEEYEALRKLAEPYVTSCLIR